MVKVKVKPSLHSLKKYPKSKSSTIVADILRIYNNEIDFRYSLAIGFHVNLTLQQNYKILFIG